MTVGELLELLKNEDPSRIVVLSADSEGNRFHPLHQLSYQAYDCEEHEIGLEALTDEAREAGYSEEDVKSGPDIVPALVFWP